MNKVKLASFVLGAALLVSPFAAMAATISNPLFSNGQTAINATGGSTVSGTFTLTVGPGEVVEFLRTQSDPSQPFVDASVGGQLGYQEQVYTNIPFSVKVPVDADTYYPTVQGAGIYGGARAINGADNVTLGSSNLGTVRVVANGNTGGSTAPAGVTQAQWDAFLAFVNGTGSTSGPSTKCAELTAKMSGAVQGTGQYYFGSPNGKLQTYLLDQGFNIPWLTDGSGTRYGFYGSQTAGALASFKTANSCN